MRVYEPMLSDPKYKGLSSEEKQRQWERDKLLYEQVMASQRLADLEEKKYQEKQNQELDELKEEYIRNEKIKQKENDNKILQLFLENATELEKELYCKKNNKEISISNKDDEVLNTRIDYTANKLNIILYSAFSYFNEKICSDRIMNTITDLRNKLNNYLLNVFAIWFSILVFGGVIIGAFYSSLNINFIYTYIGILVLYPLYKLMRKSLISYKINKLHDLIEKGYPKLYTFEFFNKSIDNQPIKSKFEIYRKYCIDIILNLNKYCRKNKYCRYVNEKVLLDKINSIQNIKIYELYDIVREKNL
ncbi:hypothetical protein [uncultured Clostridium sp.]|uniref:hypothetical protein n=1 Tax=uncultured Clostridium sp. TaxID=59620 RepID=UPI0026F04ECD|nr:hypothetical protein [uncultured Clostridium sp.]